MVHPKPQFSGSWGGRAVVGAITLSRLDHSATFTPGRHELYGIGNCGGKGDRLDIRKPCNSAAEAEHKMILFVTDG
jgi:hypothetical protein